MTSDSERAIHAYTHACHLELANPQAGKRGSSSRTGNEVAALTLKDAPAGATNGWFRATGEVVECTYPPSFVVGMDLEEAQILDIDSQDPQFIPTQEAQLLRRTE